MAQWPTMQLGVKFERYAVRCVRSNARPLLLAGPGDLGRLNMFMDAA